MKKLIYKRKSPPDPVMKAVAEALGYRVGRTVNIAVPKKKEEPKPKPRPVDDDTPPWD